MSSSATKSAGESVEKDEEDAFEPLFDYGRIQSPILVDDDESDDVVQIVHFDPTLDSKQKKRSRSYDKRELPKEIMPSIETKEAEEEDWLPPPPKSIKVMRISTDGNTVLSELRYFMELSGLSASTVAGRNVKICPV